VTETATPLDLLVVTGGHPYEAEPFFAVFAALGDVGPLAAQSLAWSHATAPETGHDVVVFYDMPGLRFTRSDPPLDLIEPTAEQRQVFADLCEAGTGLVFMHHAVAGWPAWEGYADLVGGRFHYAPAALHGTAYPDSGYRFDVRHTVEVLEPEHPVCAGLGDSFTLTDELYCFPVLEDEVTPLLRTDFDTADATQFSSADLAIRGTRNSNDGWTHPPGSRLVGWTKPAGNSRLVYLQFGDGPETYADPSFRRVLANAVSWAARRT